MHNEIAKSLHFPLLFHILKFSVNECRTIRDLCPVGGVGVITAKCRFKPCILNIAVMGMLISTVIVAFGN